MSFLVKRHDTLRQDVLRLGVLVVDTERRVLVVIVVSEVVEKVLARALSSAPFAAKHLCEWGGGQVMGEKYRA